MSGIVLLALAAPVAAKSAETTHCASRQECLTKALARSWDRYAHELEDRWRDYARARKNLALARQLKRSDLIAQARRFVEIAERRWHYAEAVADAVLAPEMTRILKDDLTYRTRHLELATDILTRKTELLRQVETLNGPERQAATERLAALAKTGEEQRIEFIFNATLGVLGTVGDWGLEAMHDTHPLYGSAILKRLEPHLPLIASGALSASAHAVLLKQLQESAGHPEDFMAVMKGYAELGVIAAPILMEAAGKAPIAAGPVPALLIPHMVALGVDLYRLGRAYQDMADAQERLAAIGGTEESLIRDVRAQGARVERLRAQRDRAARQIERQARLRAIMDKINGSERP